MHCEIVLEKMVLESISILKILLANFCEDCPKTAGGWFILSEIEIFHNIMLSNEEYLLTKNKRIFEAMTIL